MTCEDCANKDQEMRDILDGIRVSQIQAQQNLEWIVKTVQGFGESFDAMMKNGGPLAMLKMMRQGK